MMDNLDEEMRELVTGVREGTDFLFEKYYDQCIDFLNRAELDDYDYISHPLEIWKAIAQAVANVSGYLIVMQAGVFERTGEDSADCVGEKEVATIEPEDFLRDDKGERWF